MPSWRMVVMPYFRNDEDEEYIDNLLYIIGLRDREIEELKSAMVDAKMRLDKTLAESERG